jgi:hypothetical protein
LSGSHRRLVSGLGLSIEKCEESEGASAQHINMHGRYSFKLPDLPGGLRPLRDKDAIGDE